MLSDFKLNIGPYLYLRLSVPMYLYSFSIEMYMLLLSLIYYVCSFVLFSSNCMSYCKVCFIVFLEGPSIHAIPDIMYIVASLLITVDISVMKSLYHG